MHNIKPIKAEAKKGGDIMHVFETLLLLVSAIIGIIATLAVVMILLATIGSK